jgi:hypothetical protein
LGHKRVAGGRPNIGPKATIQDKFWMGTSELEIYFLN